LARGDKKARVLSAGRKVFAEKGYKKATVEDIICEANIARATFYKYFPNKRQVLLEIFRDFLNSLYKSTSGYMLEGQVLPGAISGRIRDSLVLFYRSFLENRQLVSICFSQAFGRDAGMYAIWDEFERRLVALLRKVLDRGMEKGVFRQMDTGLVARAMVMVFIQLPYRDIVEEGYTKIDIDSIADELVRFAIDGIVTRPF